VTRAALLKFLRAHRLAVEATVAQSTGVQAAVIGIAVTDDFEIIFDTQETTRKARNLARDPRVALVIGGSHAGEEVTVQYEGVADRPAGAERLALQALYLDVFPDGRDRLAWPGLIYLRVKPRWLRYSDYRTDPPVIIEFTGLELAALG
jgi:hypothetical protein